MEAQETNRGLAARLIRQADYVTDVGFAEVVCVKGGRRSYVYWPDETTEPVVYSDA